VVILAASLLKSSLTLAKLLLSLAFIYPDPPELFFRKIFFFH